MPRRASKKTPVVISNYLYTDDPVTTGIALDTPEWFAWLETQTTVSFYYQGAQTGITVRREAKQRGGQYWVAYRWVSGRLRKMYLGTAKNVTKASLAVTLNTLTNDAGR